eukprot:TCONS_00059951-protein
MNKTSETAYPRFHMTDYHRITLVTYNLLINGILTLSLNLFIVIGLIKTQPVRKNKSIQLVLLLSMSDIVGAISASSLITILLTTYSYEVNNDFEMVTLFFLVSLGHCSSYIVVLISYDRYLCVKHNNNTTWKLSSRKMNFLTTSILAISLSFGILFVSASIYNFETTANIIGLVIDLLIFAFA